MSYLQQPRPDLRKDAIFGLDIDVVEGQQLDKTEGTIWFRNHVLDAVVRLFLLPVVCTNTTRLPCCSHQHLY